VAQGGAGRRIIGSLNIQKNASEGALISESKLNIHTSDGAHAWRHNDMQGKPGQESH
jgi:hypothetical protein